VHNVQPKPNLRCKRKVLSGLEALLETVGLEVMVEGVRAAVHIRRLEGESPRLYSMGSQWSERSR